jgi:hypothetical protein
MTLGDILDSLESLDEDLTIYAPMDRPLTAESPAVIAMEPDDGSDPPEAVGLSYLIEVYLAKEALDSWSEWRGGREPTTVQRVEAIAYYADNDAYLVDEGE